MLIPLAVCALASAALAAKGVNEADESGSEADVGVYPMATINLGHLRSNHPWIRRKEESHLRQALQEIGFLVLTNHGMPRAVMDEAWNATRAFFESPVENKESVPMTEEYMYGYSADEILSRSEDGGEGYGLGADQKETFQAWIGAHGTGRDATVQWPAHPANMRDAWTAYYRECEKIHSDILRSAAKVLGVEADFFVDKIDDHMSALRALNYPLQSTPPPPGSLRCSPHSDYGTFTLLRQDSVGGLQVETQDGSWMNVISDENDFVVNIGDLLSRWTNKKWPSTRHRVVNAATVTNRTDNRRQSMAFFGNPNGEALIKTIETCLDDEGKSQFEPITFLKWLEHKHHVTQTNYDYKPDL
jgi:isopenicillin N synthase-like dioxygenase